ncbi:MAG: CD3072 family TudS-related putative desulfidase [Anaerolineae bacterium]
MPNRSKRLVLVAHCHLNQNAKVGGLAKEPGLLLPVLEVLHAHRLGVIQLPCPETAIAGTRRWWQTKRQYDIPSFRRYCRQQAVAIVDQLVDYYRNGHTLVAIVGVEGSPTCGITTCGTDADLGGPPHIPKESSPRYEKGLLMEELLDEIASRGLPIPPAIGLHTEGDIPLEATAAELDAFLKAQSQEKGNAPPH